MIKKVGTVVTDEITNNYASQGKKEVANTIKQIVRDVKPIDDISAEQIRANYASQLDSAAVSRFRTQLPSDTEVCKKEALEKLEQHFKSLEEQGVTVPEDVKQSMRNNVIWRITGFTK